MFQKYIIDELDIVHRHPYLDLDLDLECGRQTCCRDISRRR